MKKLLISLVFLTTLFTGCYTKVAMPVYESEEVREERFEQRRIQAARYYYYDDCYGCQPWNYYYYQPYWQNYGSWPWYHDSYYHDHYDGGSTVAPATRQTTPERRRIETPSSSTSSSSTPTTSAPSATGRMRSTTDSDSDSNSDDSKDDSDNKDEKEKSLPSRRLR